MEHITPDYIFTRLIELADEWAEINIRLNDIEAEISLLQSQLPKLN